MKNLSLSLMMILSVTLFSCSTESDLTGESQVAVQFNTAPSVTTQAISKESQLKQAATGTLTFTEGYIAISSLEFEVETENDSIEREFELNQHTVIDFATGVTTPDIGYITIPAGTYNEVEIEIELAEGVDEPAVQLNGTYITTDGVEHPIRFEFNSHETFEVEREGVIVLAENQVAVTQITFDPVMWFAAVTDEAFANATVDADGVIVVSDTQNTEMFNIVAEGLELARDVDMEDEDEDDETDA